MKRLISSASRTISTNARHYPIAASVIVALCTVGIARADLVTTTGTATGNSTVQPAGPRAGTNGTNFFNIEGDANGANASYGVLDFNTASFLSYGVTAVSSLTLSLVESNAAFTHPGSIEVYLASDSSATIISGSGNYTVPGYVSGLTPEGIGANPLLLSGTAPAFGTLTDLGAIPFLTTGNVNNGTVDSLTLSSLSAAASNLLANALNTNGTIRFVLTGNSTDTAATWVGATNGTTASRPSLTLTYTGSTITYVTLLWTGGSGNWDTAASSWQTSSSTFTNWSNPSGSITTASFNTATPVAVNAGGISVRALTFLTGTNGMALNGSGAATLLQGSISVATGSAVTIAAQVSGSVGFNLTGGGMLTLTNINNDFTGTVTLTNGKLAVSDAASLGNATNSIFFNGGSLILKAAQPTFSRDLLVKAGTLDRGNFDISFMGHLTNAGTGTLTLAGTGLFSMDAPDANPPGFFNSGTLIVDGGKLRLTALDGSGYTSLGTGTAIVNSAATLSFADISSSGGLNVRNAPNITLNAGSTLTATGGSTTLNNTTIRISTTAGSPVILNSGVLGDTFVINSALRDSATTGSSAVLHIVGGGILQMASGAVSAQSKPSTPAFSGTWDVSLDATGILAFGPILYGGLGEALNSPGYHAPAVNSTSNNYSGATNPITVNSGTVAFGADAVNPNNTTSALTIVSYRSPLVLNGGNIASTSYEYSDVYPNAGPGSSTPVTANLGADITVAAGKTSSVLLYDPVAGTPYGGRSLNVMTDPNAVSGGTAVSTNLTWGANGTLVVDAAGVSYNYGALNFIRTSGIVTVGAGATLQINAGAIVNLGGTQDALNDGTHQVAVINNGLLQLTGANKTIGAVTGAGTLTQAGTGTTTLTSFQGTALNVDAGVLGFKPTAGVRHTAAVLVQANAVSVATGTTLDLSNHDMLIHGGSTATLESKIGAAYFFGLWNKPGITSSTAQTNPITSLGIMSGADYNVFSPTPGTFDGVPVANTDTVIKFTYVGDLNLDGLVNDDDLFIFNGAYFFGGTGNYALGDLNFDGLVNDDDLFLFNGNYFFPPSTPLGGLGDTSLASAAAPAGGAAPVPEPASLVLLALGGTGLLLRRRYQRECPMCRRPNTQILREAAQ